MPVTQMNISLSPEMANFIRRKVRSGSYTNISEVVRAAIRRMQEEEAGEARRARTAVDDILAELTLREVRPLQRRVREELSALDRGEYVEYLGREGLEKLAAGVKTRGRQRLARLRER